MKKNWTEEWTLKKAMGMNVVFQYYRDGKLYYETSTGFTFGVPIEDTAGATFKCMDKPIYFMRWIRKELDQLTKDKLAQESLHNKEVNAGP